MIIATKSIFELHTPALLILSTEYIALSQCTVCVYASYLNFVWKRLFKASTCADSDFFSGRGFRGLFLIIFLCENDAYIFPKGGGWMSENPLPTLDTRVKLFFLINMYYQSYLP